ncbi:MAG: ABC transporter substrate-binding protein [Candidatus Hodarchaeales archaeon]|jgi:ABC-type transport system substrate-binding protein
MEIDTKKVLIFFSIIILITFCCHQTIDVSANITQSEKKPDSYWINSKGYIDRIVFKVISSDELMIPSLRSGEIDMIGQFVDVNLITQSDLTDPNLGLTQTRRRGFGALTFDSNLFPTNIRALRQGFAYALDKVELQHRCLGGASYTADSPIVPSQGIWSCEHELANCEFPGGETYYEARPDLGNETVLAQGWYDYDGDGWREFFNGTIIEDSEVVWDGGLVYHQQGTASYNENYNGYTYKGKTFNEVAGVAGVLYGSDSGEDLLKNAFKAGPWIEESDYEFDVTGSAGASLIISTVVSMSVETFHFMGIKANPSYISFTTLLPVIETNYHAFFNAHSNLEPNPLFLQTLVTDSTQNIQVTHWINSTYDNLWNILDSSPDFEEVLEASYQMQRILWQEQPKVVFYNNEMTSIYRTDRFMNQITVPGTGAYGYWSMTKMQLNEEFKGDKNYPDWPLGGTLFYGLPRSMGSQNTLWDKGVTTNAVLQLIEEGLTTRHPQDLSWMEGGGLSEDHEVISPCTSQDCITNDAEDGTKITWKIRQNVQWHDGDPLTTEDIAFSYQKIVEAQAPTFYDGLKNLKGVKYNDTHVSVYSDSSGLFEFERLQIKVYKKAIWNNTPDDDPVNFLNSIPIGTGPYKWQSRTAEEFIVLIRNEDYYLNPVMDTDNDGMIDTFENQNGLDPNLDDGALDYDRDGMSNLWEYQMGLKVAFNDGAFDQDGDGIPNLWEYQKGLDATIDDSRLDNDLDGMVNSWEYQMGLNISYNDSFLDLDNDGLSNLQEYLIGTWASLPDTDGDGMNDFFEYNNNLDPTQNDREMDTDMDGMSNIWEYQMGLDASYNDSYLDLDRDGLTNLQEYSFGSWASLADTDGDGMTDYYEYYNGLNPASNDGVFDKDQDGISNYQEYLAGSQANNFFNVPLNRFSMLHGLISLITLISITGSIIGYIFFTRRSLIRSLGAPNYVIAQAMRKGKFKNYQTYEDAHQLGITSVEDYEFYIEMKELENS